MQFPVVTWICLVEILTKKVKNMRADLIKFQAVFETSNVFHRSVRCTMKVLLLMNV